jgi:ABC-type microcin C transport system duplicated ATPase subunit YejF
MSQPQSRALRISASSRRAGPTPFGRSTSGGSRSARPGDEPHVILFDDLTSALGQQLVGEVLETMKQLAREGATMIVVTHKIGFAAHVADRVAFMDRSATWKRVCMPRQLLVAPRSPGPRDSLDTWRQRNPPFQGEATVPLA